ncbi:DUF3883 domain-containing protein [Kaistella faecalis]|uniref:DUF3883 domain-containing protein n=1 Tax=Kaistella faecalis TaxID=2852098 RepID=UPI001C47CADF|nr:DUF3883 domain-containing protein [Chryseobacterium faecale]UFK97709.1 DUF3883 domain-containing protein [Chryseobacterium faecale]
MNIDELREHQAGLEKNMDSIKDDRKALYKIRDSFAKYYTQERIEKMPLDDYVLGKKHPDDKFNFCYTLERQLDGLGRIVGSTAQKLGIYYGVTKSDKTYKYRYTKKFGETEVEAFSNIKQAIIELINFGKEENLPGIVKNKISPMFKGKILCTYFPNRYLDVFADEHLTYFLVQLNLDTPELLQSNPVYKREALIAFKNEDPVMKEWPLDIFSHFLYNYYPKRPTVKEPKNKPNKILDEYLTPEFPAEYQTEWVQLEMQDPGEVSKKGTKPRGGGNPDYEKEARKLKRLGDRGEKLVMEMEIKRLQNLNLPALAAKVKKAEFDYLGYDIQSFETNGETRYIEVKATRSKVGTANFFLSENELTKAEELKNYYIYMVYDILSTKPKIWVIDNPFNPENDKVVKTPVSYRVMVKAKDTGK